jgi:taurine dioxygenase
MAQPVPDPNPKGTSMTDLLQKTRPAGAISVEPINPTIGAHILGVDAATATPETAAAVRAAVLKHKVVFLRGQDIGSEAYMAFAELFGETTQHHPTAPVSEAGDAQSARARANVWERDNSYRSDHWHTDVTFTDRPTAFGFLRCIKHPESGGDTVFANTATAYERLPEPLRRLADGLRAYHTIGLNLRDRGNWDANFYSYVTEHPVVRVHSETGERSLLLGSFVDRFADLSAEDSTALLRIFQGHIQSQLNTVRWTWLPGDIAIWDNRATQHYAVNDYGDAERVMQRITVAGGIPVGIDGRPSVSIRGDASAFSTIGPA